MEAIKLLPRNLISYLAGIVVSLLAIKSRSSSSRPGTAASFAAYAPQIAVTSWATSMKNIPLEGTSAQRLINI